ncbi:hypothetical protein Esti_003712 [Eimeria stiedai]
MYSDQVAPVGARRLRCSNSLDGVLPTVEAGSGAAGLEMDSHAASASHRLHKDARYRGGMPQGTWQRRRSPNRRRAVCRSRSPSSGRLSLSPQPLQDQMRVDSSLSPDSVEVTQRSSRRSNERLSFHPGSASRCAPPCPPSDLREREREWRCRRGGQLREGLGEGRGDRRRWEGRPGGSPFFPRNKRSRGGGVGIRGRGRLANSAWARFGGRERRRSLSRSPSVDSVEEHRRSRSREKARRRKQASANPAAAAVAAAVAAVAVAATLVVADAVAAAANAAFDAAVVVGAALVSDGPTTGSASPVAVAGYETIQRYCRPGGEQQVCWDGFQWVRKGDSRGDIMFDQTMNATRKARRLHIGNLPLLLDATEEELSSFLWESMRRVNGRYNGKENPVLHVWFSKERGGNYGFVEMASVEDAEVALSLNPLVWKGQQLRVNRPTEWRCAEVNFAEVAGAASVPLLESVAAATAVAETTGDSSSLAKLLESLSEEKRKILADFLLKCPTGLAKGGPLPVELLQCQIQAELLHGQPSRVVRIANPVPEALTDAEMEETLADVLEEVNKRRDVLAALIITQDLEKLLPAAELGDIYVQFATAIQADICILCELPLFSIFSSISIKTFLCSLSSK